VLHNYLQELETKYEGEKCNHNEIGNTKLILIDKNH